ncbi:MAG TPA: magnesium/cobalt transporter CorA [Thermoanaerobaculia bacterium]|jgi:magnesium transporter|nr:magnesium/cobalt transporter CorA [Thermoanaerobaculia bacterium]
MASTAHRGGKEEGMARRGKTQLGKRYHRPGTAPGTLRPIEAPGAEPARVTLIDYAPDHFEEKRISKIEDVFPFRDSPTVTWINIEGLHDVGLIEKLGQHFGFHPLALEDVLNCGQRPKLEDYGGYHFLVMKSLYRKTEDLNIEQISFFLANNYVITFQEVPGDSFEAVRERIRHGKGQIRRMGPDYLLYALVDALIDEFFPVLETYGERIEELEDAVILHPEPSTLNEIHRIKRELLMLRRTAWPEREVINALQREEAHLIRPEIRVFLRDCYDHTIQVIDMIETYRDLASGLLEVYLSSASNRLNEVMKVLTIISTIFIPLSFIAGVYGMNFNTAKSPLNMPELNWYFGYPFSLAIMAAVAGALVLYFRRKGWF